MGMVGRAAELQAVRDLVGAAVAGEAGLLVVRGEPGIGKTALLVEAAESAGSVVRVLRATGTEYEQDLDYAALHQLLLPLLAGAEALPPVQRAALDRVFGRQDGPPADRFLVGLATLNLLGAAAARQPLLVLCDDVQWFDQTTVETLAFVGRRLAAERIAVLLAQRESSQADPLLERFPTLHLAGLSEADAVTLLNRVAGDALERTVAGRIVALAHGNPLALASFAADADTVDGLLLGDPLPLSRHLESRYLHRVRRLSEPAQLLLLVAAADTTGDPYVVRRAAEQLPGSAEAETELNSVPDLVVSLRFQHPLVRSAVYSGAGEQQRRRVHAALAAVADPDRHFEHRARHLAGAAAGPDEGAAAEIDAAAARAGRRGRYLTAAALAAHAAGLTPPGPAQDARHLAAARHAHTAGALQRAEMSRRRAAHLDRDPRNRALSDRLHGLLLGFHDQTAALRLLADAATTFLAGDDPDSARECLIDAFDIVQLHIARPDPDTVARLAGLALGLTGPDSGEMRLLRATATAATAGFAAAAPLFRQALPGLTAGTGARWYLIASQAAHELWDDATLLDLARRLVETGRSRDARMLSIGLAGLAHHAVLTGRLDEADEHWAQYRDIYEALTGTPAFPAIDILVHAWRGRRAGVESIAAATGALPAATPGGTVTNKTRYALVVARLADGDWPAALDLARTVVEQDPIQDGTTFLPDLVEAAIRAGEPAVARAALERLRSRAEAAATAGAAGLLARSQAVCSPPAEAEARFVEALAHLARTPLRLEHARTQLLYGEWLRRQRRRADARQQLHAAYATFDECGAHGFAGRARTELVAAGGRVDERPASPGLPELTAQEARVARLAAGGATNQEIATNLVVSPTTVDYHLRKVFRKLGITSRRQLPGLIN